MNQVDRNLSEGNRAGGNPTGVSQFMQTGVVRTVKAPYALQVRLVSDRSVSDVDLPWCYPLLVPGLLPRENELVRVFIPDPSRPQAERYWIGPVITGWEHLPGQPFPGAQFTTTDRAWVQLSGGPQSYEASDSRYPHPDHPERTHLITRGSSDVVCPPDSAYLRSARHDWGKTQQPNVRNPALIGVASDPRTKDSAGIIRAEVIALLTQGLPAADPLAPTREEVAAAAAAAHPLAFADVAAEQLEIMRQAIIEHIHPGPGKAGVRGEAFRRLLALDFTKLGSAKLVGN